MAYRIERKQVQIAVTDKIALMAALMAQGCRAAELMAELLMERMVAPARLRIQEDVEKLIQAINLLLGEATGHVGGHGDEGYRPSKRIV